MLGDDGKSRGYAGECVALNKAVGPVAFDQHRSDCRDQTCSAGRQNQVDVAGLEAGQILAFLNALEHGFQHVFDDVSEFRAFQRFHDV